MDNEVVNAVTWEAYPNNPSPKGADWFWALGIIAIALFIAALLLGNTLLGFLILIAGGVVALAAARPNEPETYTVTTRGIAIGDTLYPYSTLESFFIDEEDVLGPQLLIRSQRMLLPLLAIRLPVEHLDDIEELIASKLPEEYLEESPLFKLLDAAGL
jgi:hypothetical protein